MHCKYFTNKLPTINTGYELLKKQLVIKSKVPINFSQNFRKIIICNMVFTHV